MRKRDRATRGAKGTLSSKLSRKREQEDGERLQQRSEEMWKMWRSWSKTAWILLMHSPGPPASWAKPQHTALRQLQGWLRDDFSLLLPEPRTACAASRPQPGPTAPQQTSRGRPGS